MPDTLTVDDAPGEPLTLEAGDVLLVTPDVGPEYRAEVRAVESDERGPYVRAYITTPAARFSHPPADRSRIFRPPELANWCAAGCLLKNPDAGRERPGEPPAIDGGRYGPYERRADVQRRQSDVRNTRIARERAGRRL